jgi:type IX secretion system PorP/SprF family membrane protein
MKFTLIFFFALTISGVFGQQDNVFSQWCFNHNTYNPALAGIKNYQELKLISRFQWVGFDGAPTSHLINYSTQIQNKRTEYLTPRHGLTFQFENDNIGAFSTNKVLIGYAFHRNFTKDARFSIGLRSGVTQLFFDNEKITYLTPDPTFNKNRTLYLPNISLGLWWNTNSYYLGLSLQQIASTNWDKLGVNSAFNTHILFSAGTKFELNNAITFIPNLMIAKTITNPIRIDAIGYIDYQNQFKFGLGIRNNESILGLLQFRINHQFFVGYSVDYITNTLSSGSILTHEVNFQYAGDHIRDTEKLSCPLF